MKYMISKSVPVIFLLAIYFVLSSVAALGDRGHESLIEGIVADIAIVVVYVPPASVDMDGPSTGDINTTYTFTATVSPPTATLPITYTWQATGQSDVVTSGHVLSHTVAFAWNTTGTQIITVTAANGVGVVTRTHTISTVFPNRIYLPLVPKRWPPVPYPPTLYSVGNVDVFCDEYTVGWIEQPEHLADMYILQEAADPTFSTGLREVCATGNQSCDVHSKPIGTYYYRVRGQNVWGYGAWSDVASARVSPHCFDPTGFDRRESWNDFYNDIRGSRVMCHKAFLIPISNLTDYILQMTFQGGDDRCAQLYFKNSNWANVYSTCIEITSGKPIRFDPINDPCDVCEFTDLTNIFAVGAQIRGGIQGVELVSACLIRR